MLLIQNGHIKPMVGPELEKGCVLIGDDGEPKRKRTPRPRGGATAEVAEVTASVSERLGDLLDTRVRVEGVRTERSRGRLVVEFADLEDLRRIADIIED